MEISALTECELKRFSGAFRAGAPSPLACLPRARPFSLSPATSKRLLCRLSTSVCIILYKNTSMSIKMTEESQANCVSQHGCAHKVARYSFGKSLSLRSRRLEVAGERENGRARGRHARGEGAPARKAPENHFNSHSVSADISNWSRGSRGKN